jgi:hypothetical protein
MKLITLLARHTPIVSDHAADLAVWFDEFEPRIAQPAAPVRRESGLLPLRRIALSHAFFEVVLEKHDGAIPSLGSCQLHWPDRSADSLRVGGR